MPQPEEGEYTVRLLFRLTATDPADAVDRFIDQVINHGLRDWTYFVQDLESDEAYYVNGYGAMESAAQANEDEEWEDDFPDRPRLPDPSVSQDLDALIKLGRS